MARAALDSLLRAPVDQAVYGGAYPTMGGLLPGQVLAPKVVTAVDTLANDLNRCNKPLIAHSTSFNSFPAPRAS